MLEVLLPDTDEARFVVLMGDALTPQDAAATRAARSGEITRFDLSLNRKEERK